MDTTDYAADLVFGALFFVLLFLPSIVAFWREHPRRWWILAVNVLLGGVGIGWLAAWAMFKMPAPFTDTGVNPNESATHSCPSCGRFYDPSDYRPDVRERLCSYCGERLGSAA